MTWFKKKIELPTDEKTTVDAKAETYRVEWFSRWGQYSSDVQKECEFFTEKDDAEKFKKELDNAFAFIKHTSQNEVKLSVNK